MAKGKLSGSWSVDQKMQHQGATGGANTSSSYTQGAEKADAQKGYL